MHARRITFLLPHSGTIENTECYSYKGQVSSFEQLWTSMPGPDHIERI